MSVSFLFLTQEEMIESGVLDAKKCIETMDKALKLHGKGDYVMGGRSRHEHGVMLDWPSIPTGPNMPLPGPDKRIMAMNAYVGGEFNVAGVKWYGSNNENPKLRGLPRSTHIIILNDPETGVPMAVMDGTLVSAMRTGCIGGLGAKYLANKESEIIGIIGAGVVCRAELMAFASVLKNIKEVKVFDLVKSRANIFCDDASKELGLNVYPVDSIKESVVNSDVIGIATSGVRKPWVDAEWLKDGVYIGCLGGISGSNDIYFTTKIVVDDLIMQMSMGPETRIVAQIESGLIKRENIVELGEIIVNSKPGRINNKEKILFMPLGMPIEDVSWAYVCYKEAQRKGLGKNIDLWKQPKWI